MSSRKRNVSSSKQARLNNLKLAREKNPCHNKGLPLADESSSDEVSTKKEKLIDELEEKVNELREEIAKATTELEEAAATRSELEQQLASVQVTLVQKEKRITDLTDRMNAIRKKYEAGAKRDKRREKRENAEPLQLSIPATAHQRYTYYSNCTLAEKTERRDKCIALINEMMGMDMDHSDFAKCRHHLLMSILSEAGVKMTLSVEEDVMFAVLFSIPDNGRERMKSFLRKALFGRDIFAPTPAVRMFRKSLFKADTWRFVQYSDKTGTADGKKGLQSAFSFFDTNVQSTLVEIAQTLAKTNKLILDHPYDGVLVLVIQLDKGGSLTKIGVSFSNLALNVGSPGNFTLLGLTSLSENYDNVKMAFGDLFTQLDHINGMKLRVSCKGKEVELVIRCKIGGDYKSIAMFMGQSGKQKQRVSRQHQQFSGAASRYHCPACEGTKTTMGLWDTKAPLVPRAAYIVGEKSITKPPLIPSLKSSDITVPINHVLTGITKKAVGQITKQLGEETEEWTDEKEDRLTELNKSLAVAGDEVKRVRDLMVQIEETCAITEKFASNRTVTKDHCHKLCLYNEDASNLEWDTSFCSTCTKYNHERCARLWSGDLLATNTDFKCLDCNGDTAETLIAKDKECIVELKSTEKALLGGIEEENKERDALIREGERTADKLASQLHALKISCGVYSRYYYADLVGEDARRLTQPDNAGKLWSIVENEEVRAFGVELFSVIHEMFKLLGTGFPTPTEMCQFAYYVERLQVLWSHLCPTETVPLKVHALCHIAEAMRNEGHAGREIEVIENAHHSLNILLPRYATITPLERRLSIVVNRFNSKRFLL